MSEPCGHPTAALGNGFLRIEYLTDVSPRIARLFTPGSNVSIFGELPEAGVETPHGLWDIELVPWALTMFRLTGVAVLPQSSEEPDPSEFTTDRRLILWP